MQNSVFKYLAAVVAFASCVEEIDVPAVELGPDEYHHPLGFLKVTLVRFLHSLNARYPMNFTFLGMVILVRAEHPSNAESPIFVTFSGITILARAEHP